MFVTPSQFNSLYLTLIMHESRTVSTLHLKPPQYFGQVTMSLIQISQFTTYSWADHAWRAFVKQQSNICLEWVSWIQLLKYFNIYLSFLTLATGPGVMVVVFHLVTWFCFCNLHNTLFPRQPWYCDNNLIINIFVYNQCAWWMREKDFWPTETLILVVTSPCKKSMIHQKIDFHRKSSLRNSMMDCSLFTRMDITKGSYVWSGCSLMPGVPDTRLIWLIV